MAKVRSRYLQADFEVNSYESQENGETVQVISHEALEHIVHNQVNKEVGIRYDFTDMLISRNHCVIRCTVVDNAGRRIQAIGETVPETLETEISKNYPALMASQRAFDRAVIRYLDLPGKTLSSLENLDKSAVDNGETSVNIDEIPEDTSAAAEAAHKAETNAASKNNRPAEPAPQATPRAPESPAAPVKGDPGAVILNIGSYRGKNMTVAQVYKEKPDYIKWVIEKYNARGDEAVAIKNACESYVSRFGGNA